MDDQFFASVLRKWAYSSQEVVDLKKRLGQIERERNGNEYGLKVGDEQDSAKGSISPRTPGNAALDLDEVGHKLEIARSEYQRRLRELNDARSHKEALGYEVQELKRERSQLQSQLRTSQKQCADMTSELSELKLERSDLTARIFDLTLRVQQVDKGGAELEQDVNGFGTAHTGNVANLQERMTSLEEQLEVLQALAQNLEVANTTLREELDTTRGLLHKTKEANKGLRMTIDQLSRIARNVAGVSEPLPGRAPTPKHERHAVVEWPSSPVHSREALKSEHRRQKDEVSFSDLTIVAEPHKSSFSMSRCRLEALTSLPVIIPDTDTNEEDNKFTRGLTSAAVGNSIRRTMSDGTMKGRHHIEDYLCPRLDHNPWCPSTPGHHGYIFVGAGKEKNLYTTPQLCNVFVGLPKSSNKEERFFRYLGVYKVSRVDPLSVNEWQSLPLELKRNYIYAPKEKDRDPRTEQEVLTAYDTGKLVVSCIKLQCVEFDEELYAGLLKFRAAQNIRPRSRTSRRARCDTDTTSAYSQKTLRGAKRSVS